MSNVILISKSDFGYMAERHFKGRFAITNRRDSDHRISLRLANAMNNHSAIVLSVAQERRTTDSPDGMTWRTVRLLSAYKTEDDKLCVIEIAPPEKGAK